ncbi:hypothetical protein IscW_ISCW010365 [Ixodes scapularis]|uniref:Uncharacterized protein n=1 Tax=Ixodes scapularis TaxID=6945 RepID=B7Q977_IXOSC|nr:hypothetical protein IscW_ISCW010365 [Ixodes scapularis]|eukprot:XP_002405648.1 hypothetical protein IscW_ISCW010365 [Ixodes scapularis]
MSERRAGGASVQPRQSAGRRVTQEAAKHPPGAVPASPGAAGRSGNERRRGSRARDRRALPSRPQLMTVQPDGGTCFLSAKTPDVSNSPRLLIDTADPTQTHLVDLASIVECQPAAALRRGVSQADVYNLLKRMSARIELPVGQ